MCVLHTLAGLPDSVLSQPVEEKPLLVDGIFSTFAI